MARKKLLKARELLEACQQWFKYGDSDDHDKEYNDNDNVSRADSSCSVPANLAPGIASLAADTPNTIFTTISTTLAGMVTVEAAEKLAKAPHMRLVPEVPIRQTLLQHACTPDFRIHAQDLYKGFELRGLSTDFGRGTRRLGCSSVQRPFSCSIHYTALPLTALPLPGNTDSI